MSGVFKSALKFAGLIDRTSVGIGRATSFLVLLSIGLISASVILRYFFSLTYVVLDEIQYYLYSIVFLAGFSYLLQRDGHIRVDILNSRFSERTKILVDLLGTLFLTIPWASAICFYSFKYFMWSYKVAERSTEVSGLPAFYILKFILFLSFVLLLLQAVSIALNKLRLLIGPANGEGDKQWN